MAMITWLHLSDLHFRADERSAWNEDVVLRALVHDVERLVAENELCPDLVMVTGDVAYSGASVEYARAAEFLRSLLAATGLHQERLLLVPGNHDVDRKAITPGGKAITRSLNSRDAVDEVLSAEMDRRLVFAKFDQYGAFVNTHFPELTFDDQHYFYVRQFVLGGQRLAVLGLNSAWLSMTDEDLGRLALGERQVREALREAQGADLRIALLHHPFDWLQEFDRNDCEPLLMQGCDFILHGHLHRSGVQSLAMPDAAAMVIAAGACYETREFPNAYNLVQLDLAAGQGTVYLRRYSPEGGGFWTKDVMTYHNVGNGQYNFTLPSRAVPFERKKRVIPVPATPAADPAMLEANYLRRLQLSCNALPLAIIDPRAFERTRQQTMDLLRVYVALNTETPRPEEERAKGKRKREPEREMLERLGREAPPLTALEAAARERQMVLLGDPGSGKSTFANYLALCLAGARLESAGESTAIQGENWLAQLLPAWAHGPLLPVQVILRLFAKSESCDGTAAGLWNFVSETLDAQGLGDFAPRLRQHLLTGGVLVLLDGLDEVVAPEQRQAVHDAVADFSATYGHPANRYLVTCRGYAYQDSCWQLNHFAAHTLAPLNQQQIDAFVECWYNEVCRLNWKTEVEARDLTQRLQAATRRPDLAALARNPLQLAMMAALHFSWGRLPDDRAELYQEMVRLLLVRWQEARLGEDVGVTRLVGPGKLESALERVAFAAHRAQQGPGGTADISEVMLRSVLKDSLEGSWDQAGELLTYIKERAGLLIEHGPGVYTFPHRSYQEYLAGCYLAGEPDFPDQAAALARENYSQWREVVLWAVAVMARLKKLTHIAADVAAALCPRDISERGVSDSDWRAASLAGEALLEIGVADVKARVRYDPLLERVRTWLAAMLQRGALTPRERAQAGDGLASLGDPRSDVICDVPVTVEIPAGPFLMGSKVDNPRAAKDEHPQRSVHLDAYRLGRYPITNAQYGHFLDANPGYSVPFVDAEWARPYNWDRQKRTCPEGKANHPVVLVNWEDAKAYCAWLKKTTGRPFRLPTEREWEKAARGTDGREWPWGNEFDSDKANTAEGGIGGTAPVGCYPAGASPYGCLDMAGNVWEWTNSEYSKASRTVRGGSWSVDQDFARCAFRYGDLPVNRDLFLGFRVAE